MALQPLFIRGWKQLSAYKWLYGTSVQGIQGYIFQTNKLKDVIGASELVKDSCETDFKKEFVLTGNVSESMFY